MRVYTSEEILLAEDLYNLQDSFCCMGIPFKYQMTMGEVAYCRFIQGKYCIADFILENMDELGILTFNCVDELSKALLDDDSHYKAIMLSDETALQKLFFWLNNNE